MSSQPQPYSHTGKTGSALRRFAVSHDVRWLVFYGVILGCWLAIFSMSQQLPGGGIAALSDPGFWASICLTPTDANPLSLFGMWALMSAAMMMPTLVPALGVYDQLGDCGAGNRRGFAALVSGYVGIWLVFAVAGSSAQYYLTQQNLIAPDGSSQSLWLTGGLLVFAGAYQFSSLKDACLTRCQQPLTFFMQYWRPGTVSAFNMGARLGALCLGCCWALMALGFVGGTMNLVWMGVATVFMTIEKLPDIGRYVSRPTGVLLLVAGALVFGRAIEII